MDIIREDCIYARQSVDRKDSISIESQIDFCKYELKGGSCKVFKDKGYSGKNTDRPEFQKLLGEIRKGRVRRVIVYKLDRISRSRNMTWSLFRPQKSSTPQPQWGGPC